MFRIIPREEWGARYPNGAGPAPLPARGVFLHHTVALTPDVQPPYDDDYEAVRQLERIGQSRFKRGISYTIVVTPVGLAFEGHSVDRVGTHTRKMNTYYRAISLAGNYQENHPTQRMVETVAAVLVHGKEQGWWPEARLLGGHRDSPHSTTSCPGDKAMGSITAIHAHCAALEFGYTTPDNDDEEALTLKLGSSDKDRYGEGYARSGPVAQWQHTVNRGLVLFKVPMNGGGLEYDQGTMLKTDGEFGTLTVNATTELRRAIERESVGKPIYAPSVTDIGVTYATAGFIVNAVADKARETYLAA